MDKNSEKYLERELTKSVGAIGGMNIKIHNPYHRGLPDRLVILPDGGICWVELKSKGKKPTKLQAVAHAELRKRRQEVFVIDSYDELIKFQKLIGYGL